MGGKFVNRFGSNVIGALSLIFMASALVTISTAHVFALLVACSIVFFGATGMLDIAINAAAIAEEHISAHPLLPSAHGFFSLFAMFSALMYGLLLYLGTSLRACYLVVGVLICLYACYMIIGRPMPESRRLAGNQVGHSFGLRMFADRAILAVAFIVLLGLFGDATIGNWSAIYVRKVSHGSSVISSLAVAVYHGAMATGRFLVNHMLQRFSRRLTLMFAGIFVALGMLIGITLHSSTAAIISIFVVGLSLAMVMPISLSIGGDLRPDVPGDVSSVMIMAAYLSNLTAPVLIGSLVDHFGFQSALSTVVLVGCAIAIFGPRVAAMATRDISNVNA